MKLTLLAWASLLCASSVWPAGTAEQSKKPFEKRIMADSPGQMLLAETLLGDGAIDGASTQPGKSLSLHPDTTRLASSAVQPSVPDEKGSGGAIDKSGEKATAGLNWR